MAACHSRSFPACSRTPRRVPLRDAIPIYIKGTFSTQSYSISFIPEKLQPSIHSRGLGSFFIFVPQPNFPSCLYGEEHEERLHRPYYGIFLVDFFREKNPPFLDKTGIEPGSSRIKEQRQIQLGHEGERDRWNFSWAFE